ncbi:MAG: hypothetical protein KJ650_08140 [Firmicutes bacterium]|nr:hypothetical protein [Bacillota bacterium]MBV1728463.1 hypothetical protein [Desulforudis sp.]MBV1735752.1 hypothetical protein [Desulforudis sp.]MBV1770098.1 hypothetical protein [Desulforudis sp.]
MVGGILDHYQSGERRYRGCLWLWLGESGHVRRALDDFMQNGKLAEDDANHLVGNLKKA